MAKEIELLNKIFSIGIVTFALSSPVCANEIVSQTCDDFTVEDNQISAYCRDISGDFTKTTIIIHGLENIDGQLVAKQSFRPANFHSSCSDISIDDYGLLSAFCKSRDGSLLETSIDLDSFLVNDNGRLIDKRFPVSR